MRTKEKQKRTKNSETRRIELSHSTLIMKVVYPEENPTDAINEVTNALNHIHVFDGLKQ